MVYRFMYEPRNQYTIRETAAVFGVSSSSYWMDFMIKPDRSESGS
jgi:hypothetical protein